MKQRVVITGTGVIAPSSLNTEEFWNTIISGKSTAATITSFDPSEYDTKFACQVNNFDPLNYFSKKEVRKKDRFVQFGIAAAREAAKMAEINIEQIDANRIGVVVGSGIGGIETLETQFGILKEKGPGRVSPFVIPMFILNMVSGEISIDLGFKGPNFSTCSACASGTHAIGTAFNMVRYGQADIVLAGGAEAPVTPIGVSGFCALKALSTRNDAPEKASRPFDIGRDGFIMGEGAGMIVLESLESAKKRGAKILAEMIGYGATSDAYHITAPSEGGEGGARAMRLAVEDADIRPEDVDYINAHGTSTKYNDMLETQAIKTVFGEHAKKIKISSTKSTTGHLLGAAGGIEAVASVMSILKKIIPPTINLETPDPECDLDYTPNKAVEYNVRTVLSNSLGFGGHNGTIAFREFSE